MTQTYATLSNNVQNFFSTGCTCAYVQGMSLTFVAAYNISGFGIS